mgnify:CR=1 FL=1
MQGQLEEKAMKPTRVSTKFALLAGTSAIIAMGVVTACGSDTKESPTDTKAPTGSSAPQSPASLTPTEKQNVGSFTPTMTADKAPTRVPGRQGRLSP